MPTSFYDVVVLGANLEPLTCAALLAGRGLRVLVLGQGTLAPSYTVDGVDVGRLESTFAGLQSPWVQGVLEELALNQDVRQHMPHRENPFQLLLPRRRLDLWKDAQRWAQELSREAPEVASQAADVSRTLREIEKELDALAGSSLAWPPESFAERQRFSAATAGQRFDREGHGWASWSQLPRLHPLRGAFDASLPFFGGLLSRQHSDATRARLHAHLLGGVAEPTGGWMWLQQALVSRIRAWGSDVRASDRTEVILPQGRHGHVLRLSRSDEEIGCMQVVHGTAVNELSLLLSDRAALASLFDRFGEPRPRAYRCAVHLLVDRRCVPEALEPLGLIVRGEETPRPSAFLVRTRRVGDTRALFTLHRLVDDHLIDTASSPLRFVREDALDALGTVVPFLDRHIRWIDSPHDGLPPRRWRNDTELPCSDPWARGPHTMPAVYEYPMKRALGVCALPSRTPVRGVFLCNDQVAPGWGFEGAFLAAASTARIVSSLYRRQTWLRKGSWARRGL